MNGVRLSIYINLFYLLCSRGVLVFNLDLYAIVTAFQQSKPDGIFLRVEYRVEGVYECGS